MAIIRSGLDSETRLDGNSFSCNIQIAVLNTRNWHEQVQYTGSHTAYSLRL